MKLILIAAAAFVAGLVAMAIAAIYLIAQVMEDEEVLLDHLERRDGLRDNE